jgi:copper chaperone
LKGFKEGSGKSELIEFGCYPPCSAALVCQFRGNMNEDQAGQDLETQSIGIAGMTCEKCVQKVERTLRKNPGVKDVQIDLNAGLATVTFDHTQTDIPELQEALLQSGYQPVAHAE